MVSAHQPCVRGKRRRARRSGGLRIEAGTTATGDVSDRNPRTSMVGLACGVVGS